MGKKKIPISKIENMTKRKATYQKRHNGLLKKAKELSVLCDVDIALIMFSPTGKLTHFARDDRIEEVIAKFANTSQEEKTKSKAEMLEKITKLVQKFRTEEVEHMNMLACTSADGGERLLATGQQPDGNDENFGSDLGGQKLGSKEVEQVDMLACTPADGGENLSATTQLLDCNDESFWSDLMCNDQEIKMVNEFLNYPTSP